MNLDRRKVSSPAHTHGTFLFDLVTHVGMEDSTHCFIKYFLVDSETNLPHQNFFHSFQHLLIGTTILNRSFIAKLYYPFTVPAVEFRILFLFITICIPSIVPSHWESSTFALIL